MTTGTIAGILDIQIAGATEEALQALECSSIGDQLGLPYEPSQDEIVFRDQADDEQLINSINMVYRLLHNINCRASKRLERVVGVN